MEEMLYTVQEVAEILKTNTSFVYQLHKSGQLKLLKLGRLKCRKKSLEEFLERVDGMDVTNPYDIKKLEVGEE